MTKRTMADAALRRARYWASRHRTGLFMPLGAGVDWNAVQADASVAIFITNCSVRATELCVQGQPTIAVLGIPENALAEMLRGLGARVFQKKDMH